MLLDWRAHSWRVGCWPGRPGCQNPPPVGPSRIVIKSSLCYRHDPNDPYSIQRDHLAWYVTYNGFGQHAGPTAIPTIALALTMVVFLGLLTLCINRLQGPYQRGTGDEGPVATQG